MSKIRFDPPTPETPGYLRRMRDALEFKERMDASGATVGVLTMVVEFLLPYVSEPQDRDQAREALWDATEAQFHELLNAVSGRSENPTP